MPDETLIERLAQLINVHANAKQVFAEPVERDGITIIPVARVQWGFGGGGLGVGGVGRGGAGGGVRATPAGFIEIRNGQAEFRRAHDVPDSAVLGGTALAGVAIGFLIARLMRG